MIQVIEWENNSRQKNSLLHDACLSLLYGESQSIDMSYENFRKAVDPLDVEFEGTTEKSSKRSIQCSTKTRKWILIVCVVLLVVIIVAALLGYFLSRKHEKQIAAFQEMENDMDKRANPCDNFYQFACGNYISRYNEIMSGGGYMDRFLYLTEKNTQKAKLTLESMSKTNDPTFKKAYNYYTACMNSKRMMDVYWRAAENVGGSELTDKGVFNLSTWNSDDALLKLKRDYNVNAFFTITVGPDLLNTSQNIFWIFPPETDLLEKTDSDRDQINFPPQHAGRISKDNIQLVQALVKNFNSNVKDQFTDDTIAWTGKSRKSIMQDIQKAKNFESTLLEDIKSTMKEPFNYLPYEKFYKHLTIKQLNNITNNKVNWLKIFKGLVADINSTPVTEKTMIGLMVPEAYLKKVGEYFKSSLQRGQLPNFFSWILLKKLSPVLPDTYFAAYYLNSPASQIGKSGKERWRACLKETQNRMPLTVGLMFTKKVSSKKNFDVTNDLLKRIVSTFMNGAGKIPWLDDKTRSAVLKKVKDLVYTIANPDMISSDALAKIYKDVKSQSDIADFFLSCVRNVVRYQLKMRDKKPDRNEVMANKNIADSSVNAYYDRTKNRIRILAGILQEPFVYTDTPSYINFGKTGFILGHELLHGFDTRGKNFDGSGQIRSWWTKKAADAFKKGEDCVAKQYSNYIYGSHHLDGNKTLSENIADLGGLKYAYEAFKSLPRKAIDEQKPAGLKTYTYDQLFFLAFAQVWCRAIPDSIKPVTLKDVHSPYEYRVIGSLSNSQQFARAYNCKIGSKMNPVPKCVLW